MPYGRSTAAMPAAFWRSGALSDWGLALTLLMTAPLIPMDAFARA